MFSYGMSNRQRIRNTEGEFRKKRKTETMRLLEHGTSPAHGLDGQTKIHVIMHMHIPGVCRNGLLAIGKDRR